MHLSSFMPIVDRPRRRRRSVRFGAAVLLMVAVCSCGAAASLRHRDAAALSPSQFPFGNDGVADIPNVGSLTFGCTQAHRIITTVHGQGLNVTMRQAGARPVHVEQISKPTFVAPSEPPGTQVWFLRHSGESATADAQIKVTYALTRYSSPVLRAKGADD